MFCFTSGCKDFRRSHLLIFEIGSAFKRICDDKEQKNMCCEEIIGKNVDY